MKKETSKQLPAKKLVIDFAAIELADLEGNKQKVDISKQFGNFIYQTTGDLGMLEAAQIIYAKGKLEVSDDARKQLVASVKDPKCPFVAVIKKELLNKLGE